MVLYAFLSLEALAGIVHDFLGPSVYAVKPETRAVAAAPVLSEEELSSLGILRSMLTTASPTERRIFDHRSPKNPRDLDPWILKTLHDSKLEYTLLLVGPPEEVSRFRSELRNYVQSRYKVNLPPNFQLAGADSPELLTAAFEKLVSKKKTPAGIVSENRTLLERIGYRGRFTFLRALGDPQSAEIQNATGLLTDAWLLRENLPLEIRTGIHSGQDLGPNREWDDLLATLRGRAALLAAA